MPQRSPNEPASSSEQAHPLVKILIADLTRGAARTVIEIGSGRGRNTAAMRAAGLEVTAVTDDRCRAPLDFAAHSFDAAISTHGFFHGHPRDVAALGSEAARVLRPQRRLYVTLPSLRDGRFGRGLQIDVDTFAPEDGPEQGVPHVYFSEKSARALLEPGFRIEELYEVEVSDIVGRWAHAERSDIHHWFVIAATTAER